MKADVALWGGGGFSRSALWSAAGFFLMWYTNKFDLT